MACATCDNGGLAIPATVAATFAPAAAPAQAERLARWRRFYGAIRGV
jgi:hypothetical protein